MGNRFSPGCTCCGCALWSADFRFSYKNNKPTDKQYFYPSSRIGIPEGVTGHGLQFVCTSAERWEKTSQWVVPVLVDHPNMSELDLLLAGDDGAADSEYYYSLIELGVQKQYRVSKGGTPVLHPSTQSIVTLVPWQDEFSHTHTSGLPVSEEGLLLKVGEEISLGSNLPNSPWSIAFSNVMATSVLPTTKSPFWMTNPDSGLQLDFVDDAEESMVRIKIYNGGDISNAAEINEEWHSFGQTLLETRTDDDVAIEVEIDGISQGKYWILDGRLAGADLGMGTRISYVPGMVSLTGKIYSKDEDKITIPVDYTSDRSYTWTILDPREVRLVISALVEDTIVSGMSLIATRMPEYTSEFGPVASEDESEDEEPSVGYRVEITAREECTAYIQCANVYPHGHQRYQVLSVTCDSLVFDTEMAHQFYFCTSTRYTENRRQAESESILLTRDYDLNVVDFKRVEINDTVGPSFDSTAVETGTLSGDTTQTHTAPSEAGFSIVVTLASDTEDEQYVFITVLATIEVYGVRPLSEEISQLVRLVGFPLSVEYSSPSTDTIVLDVNYKLHPSSNGVNQILSDIDVANITYRKRIPRWKALSTSSEISFTDADRIAYSFGALDPKSTPTTVTINWSLETITASTVIGGEDYIESNLWLKSVGILGDIRNWNMENLTFTIGGA